MVRLAHLEIHKEELSFSAGHFTIFSATEREQLHGHNYSVNIAFIVKVEHNGLAFDYRYYKNKVLQLCRLLDRHFLLPQKSPYLQLEENGDYWLAHFNQQKIPFLKEDVIILPISNVTIEELSHWFLEELLKNQEELNAHFIDRIDVNVFNGPGQSGGSRWVRESL